MWLFWGFSNKMLENRYVYNINRKAWTVCPWGPTVSSACLQWPTTSCTHLCDHSNNTRIQNQSFMTTSACYKSIFMLTLHKSFEALTHCSAWPSKTGHLMSLSRTLLGQTPLQKPRVHKLSKRFSKTCSAPVSVAAWASQHRNWCLDFLGFLADDLTASSFPWVVFSRGVQVFSKGLTCPAKNYNVSCQELGLF